MNRIMIFFLCLGLSACSGKVSQEIPTAVAVKGTFTGELTEEGIVRAVNSTSINAPNVSYRYGSLKITRMIVDGTEVEAGDTVMIFDPSEIRKAIINSEQQLEIANAEYEKIKATQESEIEDLEADLEITRISQEISKINFEQAVFESEVTRKEINLKLETANISLERAKEQIENKKKIQKEELLQKKLNINQLQKVLDEANSTMDRLFVISPSKGIAILKDNWMTNQKWQVGDQPYSGTSLIDLPNLDEMFAEIKINEVDVAKVIPGQRVVIQADAFSDTTYTGKVTDVANLAQNKDNKSKIKVFPVKVLIDGVNPKLLPGLTVSCKILVSEILDVIYVPVDAVFKEQGQEYLYVKGSSGFKRRDVKIGSTNNDFAIVLEGLEEDEEVALINPFLNRQDNEAANGTKSTNQ